MGTREKVELENIEKTFIVIENAQIVTHDISTANSLCVQPCYNYKRGCPNFGKKEGCPPNLKHISEEYDMNSIHILLLKFPFGEYFAQRKEVHPDWTDRALINPRHWQNHLKACLNREWENIKDDYPEHTFIQNPEGQGVNIVETLEGYEIEMEWSASDESGEIVSVAENLYRVAMIGKKI
ncbi:MAG: hypothetical protein ACOX0R_03195 [Candidatus Dojkabacteria bacterium]